MTNIIYRIIFIIAIIFNQHSYAGIEDHMSEFWDSLGGASNVNKAQFIKGQKAGHISLGGFQMRSNIQNSQLVSAQLPSVRAGCGGIDFFAGGFSFISSDQLIALGKSIISNSPGALAQLALDNISPEMGSVLKYFQNVTREINKLNINSCKAATALISDRGGLVNDIKSHGCRTWGLASNQYQDAAEASEKCSSGGHASKTKSKESEKVSNTNIAWKAFKDAGLVRLGDSGSEDLAQLFMTLTGTIIISGGESDNEESQFIMHSSKINSPTMIDNLMEGGEIQILKCADPTDCLEVTEGDHTLESGKSFLGLVDTALKEIKAHVLSQSNSTLSDNTIKLMNMTSIPVYKFAAINARLNRQDEEITSLSEYIAFDILSKYLLHISEATKKATDRHNNGAAKKVYEDFFEEQKHITDIIKKKQLAVGRKYQEYITILNRAITIEKKANHLMSKDLRSMGIKKTK